MKVLVTGATGFVGNALVQQLLVNNIDVVGTVRVKETTLPDGVSRFISSDISSKTDWSEVLQNIDVIIHE